MQERGRIGPGEHDKQRQAYNRCDQLADPFFNGVILLPKYSHEDYYADRSRGCKPPSKFKLRHYPSDLDLALALTRTAATIIARS